ncbi:MAG: flagellar basal body-associated FliL family protein [Gammaproteobacteria bacterium]|nr:flagellar basal body-associated FliL family protein [Gammaproteobacteria bacterium]MCP5298846.1 flagellar basal body-associated FliL family protein [Chromatiaceae bacterium]
MPDDKDIAEGGQGGGKKKLIVIVAIVAVLLIGGGTAAFFLLGGDEEAVADGDAPPVEEQAVEQVDPVYHKLDPEFVVNLPPGGPAGMLQIAVEVMTQNPTVVETLKKNDPMIRHHIINLLEEQDAAKLLTLDGKKALQAAISELLAGKLKELNESGEIRGVFFTQFVLQ